MSYLKFPMKLYGRESQILGVSESLALVRERGRSQMLLVSGSAGVGKTAVVNQGAKAIARPYVSAIGKCDPLQRYIPYSVFIAAFRDLIKQRSSYGDEQLRQWREHLLQALGANGQVMIDVIPEIESIIGQQVPVPELDPIQSQHRFNIVFQRFIRACCSQANPLIVFLDDLQWADSASLHLIELIMTDPDRQYVLLIGAYRHTEIDSTHPLTITLEKLQTAGADTQHMHLTPLSHPQVNQLISDTLQDSAERTKPLSELAFRQTAGNPLFLRQSLHMLCLNKQLFRDTHKGTWNWQIEQLPKQDLLELISENLARLPGQTNHLLKRTACFGNGASLKILAAIGSTSAFRTLLQLRKALKTGWIAVCRESPDLIVRFVNDRIQQAVYESIPASTRVAIHLATGRLLQASEQNDLFTVVNHLNLGSELIKSRGQQDELATLNLRAAQQAKSTVAFGLALTYIRKSLGFLDKNSWQRNADLTWNIYREAIEIEYLNSNFEQSHQLAAIGLTQANTALKKISVQQLKIKAYIAQSQFREAFDLGLLVLEGMGIELQTEPPKDLSIEGLDNLPPAVNQIELAALEVLTTISDITPFVDPDIFPSMLITEVALYWKYGTSNLSACVCIDYAFLLCAAGEIELGKRYGDLALKLLEKLNLKRFYCKVINIYHCGIKHWVSNIRKTLKAFKEAIQSGIENGDKEFTGCAVLNYCTHALFASMNLVELERDYEQYTSLLTKLNLEFALQINLIFNQLVVNLLGRSAEANRLRGDIFNAEASLPVFQAENNTFALFMTGLGQGMLSYLFEDYAQALTHLEEATQYAAVMNGFATPTQLNFYHSLALLGYYRNAPLSEHPALVETVAANQRQMENWAKFGPMNFLHKFHLVEAELARVQGRFGIALAFYQKAIEGARQHGYLQEEALAHELAMQCCLQRHYLDTARTHFSAAYRLYLQWGAVAKVKALEKIYFADLVAGSSTLIVECFLQNQLKGLRTILGLCTDVVYRSETRTIQLMCSSYSLADLIRSEIKLMKTMPELTIEIVVQS